MTTNKTYKPLLIDSVLASADLEQHRFIGFDGNYCAAGAKALGVSDVAIEKGQYVPVAVLGILLVEAAETIAVGDAVASDADGKAVKFADSANAISTLKDIQKGVISLQSENDSFETAGFNAEEYKTNKDIIDRLFGKHRLSEY